MKFPRLLPLIAVAIGGVVAVNAMAGAGNMGELFTGARAFAEDAVAKVAPKAKVEEKAAAPKEAEKLASPMPEGRILDESLASKPQGVVCAPDLANQAGLSSYELQFLQSLGVRRSQIETLEKNVDVQQALLTTAEAKVDAKITTLRSLIADMQKLLGEADEKQKADTARLVKIYEGMKPEAAAQAIAIMTDDVRLDIAAGMKERNLSAILNKMPAPAAKNLTEKLAQRYAAAAAVKAAQNALAPAPAAAQTAAAPQPKGPAPKGPAPKAAPPRAAAPAPKQAAATPPPAVPAPAPAPATPPTAAPEVKTG